VVLSGRSVRRGLGIPASIPALLGSGLWLREQWYFSSFSKEVPLPVSPRKLSWSPLPEGWERSPLSRIRSVRKAQLEVQRSFFSDLTASAWLCPPSRGVVLDSYFAEVRMGGHEGSWRWWKEYHRPRPFGAGDARARFVSRVARQHRRCGWSGVGSLSVTSGPARSWLPSERRGGSCWSLVRPAEASASIRFVSGGLLVR